MNTFAPAVSNSKCFDTLNLLYSSLILNKYNLLNMRMRLVTDG